ncbi:MULTISPECIES: NF038122 family metalloprotease [unclassified Bradyrhizobium]|uniref:NF038122 family metalloprotease n=1 Tax=unclassified Bradyrhizobium TaxID=2631580 RepID=UPI001AEDBE4E|nr:MULTISPECIES: NF038122 family metalloprotease [unclassified Bradyrhizobium]
MRSKFVTDLDDPSDRFLNLDGDQIYALFSLPTVKDHGTPSGNGPVNTPAASPALVSEAVQSSSAQSGTITTTSLTSGGITINLQFDAAAMAAPASFRAGIQQAASILTSAISDKITVNIKIDYSGTGGGAAAGPDNGLYESYSSVRTDLINSETPSDTTFNALPIGSSVQGQSKVAVWNAQLKLFGLLGANDTTTDDGSATFATDINSSLLVGVALHELTHAMGRVPYGPPYSGSPDIFDLYRFTNSGTQLINGASTAPAAYFSLDGGNTKLADFGQNSDPSDFLNSGVQGGTDPFNEYYTGGTLQRLTAADKALMDALGFHLAVVNYPPVVTASNLQETHGMMASALSAQLQYSDADGDQAFHWRIQDVSSDSTGAVMVNGVLLAPGAAPVEVTQAQFAAATIQSVSAAHEIWAVVSDGTAWSSPVHFTVSAPAANHAPVVTASNLQETRGMMASALSAQLQYSDADGDQAFHWRIQDVSSDSTGAVMVNGMLLAPGAAPVEVTQAQFAAATIQSVSAAHEIWAVVSDGTAWSSPVHFTVSAPAANHAPVVTASNLQETHGMMASALSAQLQYSDADGDQAFHWRIQDVSSDSTGAVMVNGMLLAPGAAPVEVTQAQFAAATIQSVSAAHEIWAVVSDGTAWSSPVHFTVSAPAANHAPVVTASNLQETHGMMASALSAQLQYSDADGDQAFHWRIQDVSSDSTGAVMVNGMLLAPGAAPVEVTQAQFAAATIQSVSAAHEIWAVVSDGTAWSSPVHFTASPASATGPQPSAAIDQLIFDTAYQPAAGSPPLPDWLLH